ncbi:MAG TPA: M3 family oligoendopeptidase [Lacibacter sp.]|nr:M3 family oligoendopeptidase [Lacibacter sp.]HMO88305.1 M3 family oligoendopeptidase [Lacibacter sp.]HMP86581.1 M3 family oligoendopeptidase [Lacibacter sp.]
MLSAAIQPLPRHFLPAGFSVTTWDHLEPFFSQLLDRPLNTRADLEQWLLHSSELEAVISEDACWRQVRMTCDTENKELEEAFNYFYLEIAPRMQPYADKLNRKLVDCPLTAEVDPEKYFTYLRSIRKSIELFREENIPLLAELNVMQQQFGQIAGKMTIEVKGQEYTLQQAARFLEQPDRELREEVYRKVQERRYQDREALNELFGKLVDKRHQVAVNAGFANYRDFKFKELGRFDYTPDDCFRFHDAIRQHVVPLVKQLHEHQRKAIGVDQLRPWDMDAEPAGVQPLQPFRNGGELLEKSIACFRQLHPFFADCLLKMQEMNRFDLDSRKGKAPGGYNMPLAETGAPFIFMNAAGTLDDVTTMVHEGGHAVHSFLTHGLELTGFKEYGSEIAEVASMAMELFSMEHWEVFFPDVDELRRARFRQLERVLTVLPWIARIDAFQHWIYEHPYHTAEERGAYWMQLAEQYSTGMVDYSGLEHYRPTEWQRQLHLFEVPFYYIEYGIAQLGAIGLWMQFRQNPEAALQNYMHALQLGGTRPLPELYAAAGLKFDFSPEHIQTLMAFVQQEMEALQ